MTTETLTIEGSTVTIDYDSIPEERPSMDSPGCDAMLCINRVTFKDGKDALPFIMAIDDETEAQTLAWVGRLLDRKLTMQAEDQQGERAAERMRAGRRA